MGWGGVTVWRCFSLALSLFFSSISSLYNTYTHALTTYSRKHARAHTHTLTFPQTYTHTHTHRFCVGCEAFILSPEEAQAQGLDISGADAAPASPARPADAMFADVASMYAEATGGASSPRQQPLSPVRSPPKSKFKQPRRTGGGGGGGGGVGGGVQLSNVERRGAAGARGGAASGAQQSMDAALEDTLQALADKLDASRRALGETTDMGACREILSFMNEIMETVDRVQRSVE